MSWQESSLGTIADMQLGKMLDAKKNDGEYHSYLGNDNIQWDGVNLSEIKEMRFKDSELAKFALKPGDLLVCEGGDPGRCAIWDSTEEMYYQKALHRVRAHEGVLDNRFLYYFLVHIGSTQEIRQYYTGGATIKHLPKAALERVVVRYPDLETQRRIAGVLSAYDKLIENNRKQIKLLEEAAQRLYKEWFVDLRFPGYETTPVVNGLPEGWKRLSLRNYLVSHIGGGWGKEFSESSYPIQAAVIRATDIKAIRNGNVKDIPVRWHSEANFQKRELEAGDIVFEVSGGSKETGVGRSLMITEDILSMFDGPVICASFCKRIHLADSDDSALLYWKIRNDSKTGLIRKYEKSSAGNIINFLWEDFLDGYELLVPSSRIKEQFESTVGSYSKKLGMCFRRISFAREARDRLLPKLMSGEIEVWP